MDRCVTCCVRVSPNFETIPLTRSEIMLGYKIGNKISIQASKKCVVRTTMARNVVHHDQVSTRDTGLDTKKTLNMQFAIVPRRVPILMSVLFLLDIVRE